MSDKMIVKLKDLVGSETALEAVSDLRLNEKVAYRLARIRKYIFPEITNFHEIRDKKLAEFGKPIEGKPGQFQVQADSLEAFTNAIKELGDIEVEVPFGGILLSDLENEKVSAKTLGALEWLIAEKE